MKLNKNMKARFFGILAVAFMLAVAMAPLAGPLSDVDATGTTKATAQIPVGQEYMYILSNDADNMAVTNVIRYVPSSNGFEQAYANPVAYDYENNIEKMIDLWGFDSDTGLGPFNSFYAAINLMNDNAYYDDDDARERRLNTAVGTVAYVLDPTDLKKTLMGSEFTVSLYNVMLVIPTVYWYADEGHLYMTGTIRTGAAQGQMQSMMDAAATTYETEFTSAEVLYGSGGLTAYAHSYTLAGDDPNDYRSRVAPYIALAVYESSITTSADMVGADKVVTQSGRFSNGSHTSNEWADLVSGSGTAAGGSAYQTWNFYQWTLYKMMSYTVMGTKNVQIAVSVGDTDTVNSPNFTLYSGSTDTVNLVGPAAASATKGGAVVTADNQKAAKLFLENTWGSYWETIGSMAGIRDGDGYRLYADNRLGGLHYDAITSQVVDEVLSPGMNVTVTAFTISAYAESAIWDLPKSRVADNTGQYNTIDYPGDYSVSPSSTETRNIALVGGTMTGSNPRGGVADCELYYNAEASSQWVGNRMAYVMSAEAVKASSGYTVTYDSNGGSNPEAFTMSVTADRGNVHTAVHNLYVSPSGDKKFAGWNTSADGSGTSYQPGDDIEITSSVILYAQWSTDSHTVTISFVGGDSTGYNINTDRYSTMDGMSIKFTIKATAGYTIPSSGHTVSGGLSPSDINVAADGSSITISKASLTSDAAVTLAIANVGYKVAFDPGTKPADITWTVVSETVDLTNTDAGDGQVNISYKLIDVVGPQAVAQDVDQNYVSETAVAKGGYELPNEIIVTIGSETAVAGTDYTWSAGKVSIDKTKLTGDVLITIAGTKVSYASSTTWSTNTSAGAGQYNISYVLKDVTGPTRATGTVNQAYASAAVTANVGWAVPATISVTINGAEASADKYTWENNIVSIAADTMSEGDDVVITIRGDAILAPADLEDQSFTYGTHVIQLGTENRNGLYYSTDGISYQKYVQGGIAVTGATILYLKHAFVLSFSGVSDSGSGTGSMSALSAVAGGSEIEVPECTYGAPEGYVFMRWATASDGTGESYLPGDKMALGSDLTLYAIWISGVRNVILDDGDDQTESDGSVQLEPSTVNTFNFVAPVKDGFSLLGFTKTNDGTDYVLDANGSYYTGSNVEGWTDGSKFINSTEEGTLYAKWGYQVTYNMLGHGTQVASQIISQGDKFTKPDKPEATGYRFDGWYQNSDCTGVEYDFNSVVSASVTLYAKWMMTDVVSKALFEPVDSSYTYNGQEHKHVTMTAISAETYTQDVDYKIVYTSSSGTDLTSAGITVTATVSGIPNSLLEGSVVYTYTISQMDATVSGAAIQNEYDGNAHAVLYTDLTAALADGDAIVSAVFGGAWNITNVNDSGAYTITSVVIKNQDGAGDDVTSNYNLTLTGGARTNTVTPAALTLTPQDITLTYGDAVPVWAQTSYLTVTGLVDTVTAADVYGTINTSSLITSNYATTTDVGAFTMGWADSAETTLETAYPNYDFALGAFSGTYQVTPKKITVAANTDVFNGTTAYTSVLDTSDGIINSDVVNAVYTLNAKDVIEGGYEFADALAAGKYTLVLSGADGGNYELNTTGHGNFTVTAKPITIALDGSKTISNVYCDSTDASAMANKFAVADFTTDDLLGSDTLAAVVEIDTQNYADKNAAANINVDVVFKLADGVMNYSIANADSKVTTAGNAITPIQLTISGSTVADKVYNAETDDASVTVGTVTGVLTGETANVTVDSATYASANVGDAVAVTVVYAVDNTNYLAPVNDALTGKITPIQLTISEPTVAESRNYDSTTVVAVTAGTLVGVLTGETVTVSATGSIEDANVGEDKAVTVVYAIDGAGAGNYLAPVDDTSKTIDILAIQLTISGSTVADKQYNAKTDDAAVTVGTVTGVLTGETANVTVTSADYASANVGDAVAVTVVYAVDNTNYLAPVNDALTGKITPKTVGLQWTAPADLVYSKTAKVPTVAATDVLGDDEVNVTASLTEGKDNVNVGTFTFTATALSNANYALPENCVSDEYTITPALLSVTWTGNSFVYNGEEQGPTAAFDGLKGSDVLEPTIVDGKKTDVGDYAAKVVAFEEGNYKLVADSEHAYTITAKSIAGMTITIKNGETVVPDGAQLVYTGQELTITYTIDGKESIEGITAGKWMFNDDTEATVIKEKGKYSLTFTGSGNYTGERTVSFYIVEYSPEPTGYKVTIKAGTGGSVSTGAINSVAKNTAISASGNILTIGKRTVTATAADGYVFDSWSGVPEDGKVTKNMTVNAIFKAASPTDPVEKDVTNGSVIIPAEVARDIGVEDRSKLILAIDSVTPTQEVIPADAKVYDITLTYDGKPVTTFSGAIKVVIKYTPKAGESTDSLNVYYVSADGNVVEDMNATYSVADKGMVFYTTHFSTYAITGEEIEPNEYSITVTNDGNGTATASVSEAAQGTKVTLTATPKAGYVFKAWVSDDVTISGNTFVMPGKDVTVKATFEEAKYTVTVKTDGDGKATATPTSGAEGTKVTLKATASDGYTFKEWKSSDVTISGDSFNMPAKNVTVTAVFEKESSGSDNTILIVVIVIVVLAVIAGGAYFYFTKKKKE